MSKVLAITVALMIAAMVLTPALGYTGQSAGNQSYTAISGARVAYSISSGVPAHNLTQEMIASKYSIKAPAVQGSRVPYSFQEGVAMPYSIKLVGVSNALPEGFQVKKEAARVGEAKPAENEQIVTGNETVPAAINETPVAPVEQPKFSIAGVVFDDVEGNGVIEANEAGLANWTVNLEQPAGTIIESATTTMDGKFAFMNLTAGEYTVSEVMQMDWNLIAPADNRIAVSITNASVSDLAFANQMIPVEIPAVVPVATENVTALTNATNNTTAIA